MSTTFPLGAGESDGEALDRLAASTGPRIEKAVVAGQTVWVKRYGAQAWPLLKRLHASWPFLPALLRSSPAATGVERVAREARKIEAFSRAGFPVPQVLAMHADTIVLSNVGSTLGRKLRIARKRQDWAEHDRLLLRYGEALGLLHAAGLCHGRPHPRDMFVAGDGRIGFFDFEEEPERVMPLPAAQARDLWLLFLPVAASESPAALRAAFDAYRAAAPAEVMTALKPWLRLFVPLAAIGRRLPVRVMGDDFVRLVAATSFFQTLNLRNVSS